MFSDVKCEYTANPNADSKTLAYCDVTLGFADSGRMTLRGFRVLRNEKGELWASPPAKKGERQWFDQIVMTGHIRAVVFGEIVKQYGSPAHQGAGQ